MAVLTTLPFPPGLLGKRAAEAEAACPVTHPNRLQMALYPSLYPLCIMSLWCWSRWLLFTSATERWVGWKEGLLCCVRAALFFTAQVACFPYLAKINGVAACHFKIRACMRNSSVCLWQLSTMLDVALYFYQLSRGNVCVFLLGWLPNLQVRSWRYWNVMQTTLSM